MSSKTNKNIHPDFKQNFVNYLNEELKRRKERNSSYSLRSFAHLLEMNSGALSQILAEKRPISYKSISKISKILGIEEKDLKQIALISKENTKTYQNILWDNFELISQWYYFAFLELIKIKSFNSCPRWIATSLGIEEKNVSNMIQRLERLGMIQVDSEGHILDLTNGDSTTVETGFTTIARQSYQIQLIEKSKKAVMEVPFSLRNQSGMTMAIDSRKLNEVNDLLKKFRRDMDQILSSSDNLDSVYHLNISLFPLTTNSTNGDLL